MSSERQQTLDRILDRRVSAIIRTQSKHMAGDAMAAAVDGGFELVEFTLTTPGALELISEFASRPNLVVGAGTVMSADMARDAVSSGARFLVSPLCDPDVVRAAADLGVVVIPGAQTPTEMHRAHTMGADLIKLFPAPFGGVDFVRAVRGPLPHLKLFPTAGVDADNFLAYFDAGCAGAGFVRSLFNLDDLSAGSFDAIRRRAALIIARLEAWKKRR
ncbi:MAG: bifunctional 4-hydroxy-2-oxoglutarate aldolase/2-dehydro-3-deoxy-phosphogluconate aldolase [Phycisphaerae bacterium]